MVAQTTGVPHPADRRPLDASAGAVRASKVPERLRVPVSIIDRMAFGPDGGSAAPHLLRLLVSTVLATEEEAPFCIVLPSAGRVASVVAIMAALECLSCDLPEGKKKFLASLRPGQRVRLYPTGEVFEIGGVADGMLRLHFLDAKNRRSNASWSMPVERAFRFEPTFRDRPLGTASVSFGSLPANDLEAIVGSQLFGNSGLIRTRILVAGPRTEFERTLHDLMVQPRDGFAPGGKLVDVLPFGTVDTEGSPIVVHPPGSAGQPMVAIARDLLDLEHTCLADGVEPHSRAVLTDRIDLVLRDLSLAGRIAERQRLIAFVDARKRADLEPLRKQGWTIWEISPNDILGGHERAARIGSLGIDRSLRGAASEIRCRPGFVTCKAPELERIDEAMTRLGQHLSDEEFEHEMWAEDLRVMASDLFFASSGWLSAPRGEAREAVVCATERLRSQGGYLGRQIGPPASAAVVDLASAIDRFRSSVEASDVTPKGAEVLNLARRAAVSSFRQVFVAGNRQSRQEADAFFTERGLGLRCLTVEDLLEAEDPPSIVAFSVMRRDIFERLVDPWPSPSTLFVGYDFEIACYRRRLERRSALKTSLRLDEERRSRVTGLPRTTFATAPDHPSKPATPPEPDDKLVRFDRATREWNWTSRISIPGAQQGVQVCQARVVHFVGRSWSAMTDDHRSVMLSQGSAAGGTAIHHVRLDELVPGARLILREGGDRDVIRELAAQRKGEAGYRQLRERAALWRSALRSVSIDARDVAARLKSIGVNRHPATVRAWLTDGELIAPRSIEDVKAIGSAFPVRGKTEADWRACCAAIGELRSLHVSAGSQLADLLVARCGKMLFEPSDTELAIDLGIGIVWVVEVSSIDPDPRECPLWYVNRLQWLSPDWREHLLAAPVREAAD